MSLIFLDESGYTGSDLLNAEQPVLVLASLCLPEPECQSLKDQFFGRIKAPELKFTRMVSRPAQQDRVVAFLQEVARRGSARTTVCNKQYALVGKIVDMLIEPVAHAEGFDLYQEGFNQALADLMYWTFPKFIGANTWSRLLRGFQRAVRERTQEAYTRFLVLLDACHSSEPLVETILGRLRQGAPNLRAKELGDVDHFDIVVSSALDLMSRWRKGFVQPITLIHDRSSPMAKERRLWEALVDPSQAPAVIGYDHRTMIFPIGVETTLAEDSRDWAGLQLADVLAGSLARFAKSILNGKTDQFSVQLQDVVLNNADALVTNAIWPADPSSRKTNRTETGEIGSPIDYLSEVYRNVADTRGAEPPDINKEEPKMAQPNQRERPEVSQRELGDDERRAED